MNSIISYINTEIHRVRNANYGAWKSVPCYCFNKGIKMIESNSYISGRDRYNNHSERFSEDNGKTWHNEEVVLPNITEGDDVTRACETFIDLDKNTNTLFRVYDWGTYCSDSDGTDTGNLSFARNCRLLVQTSTDGGHSFSKPVDIIKIAEDMNAFPLTPDIELIRLQVSCSHLEVLADGTLVIPIIVCSFSKEENVSRSESHKTNHYNECAMLIGMWNDKKTCINWQFSKTIPINHPDFSGTLGETSVTQLDSGKLLAVSRGGNCMAGTKEPWYKWMSVSDDNGYTWAEAKPLTYTNGTPLCSPSSCCRLWHHSSGKLFLIGNIHKEQAKGINPRGHLHIVEIDQNKLKAIKGTLTVIDEQKDGGHPISLSNFAVYEDRITKEICVMVPYFFARPGETKALHEDCLGIRYRIGIRMS